MTKKAVAPKEPKERPGRVLSEAEEPFFRVRLLESELLRIQKALRAAKKNLEPKLSSIEDALRYDTEDLVGDVVRGNLAIAYLLESVSQSGSHPVDGTILLGLAEASRHYAKATSQYLIGVAAAREAVHEASKTGGDLLEAISHAAQKAIHA